MTLIMKLHVTLATLAFLGRWTSYALTLSKGERTEDGHHLAKRQAAQLEPIPYRSRDHQQAPLPYQQGQGEGQRDYQGGVYQQGGSQGTASAYPQGNLVEDWVDSSDIAHGSASTAQGGRSGSGPGGTNPGLSGGGGGGGRPYYQYQPPISSGRRGPSPDLSSRVPTQTHVAGSTRNTQTRPASTRGRSQSRTYTYPFNGGRAADPDLGLGQQGRQAGGGGAAAGGGVGVGGGGGAASAVVNGSLAGQAVPGDDEPVIRVFPSEQPVVNPGQGTRQQYQQLLRQRQMERQRRRQQQLQQRQQGGRATSQQQRQQGGRASSQQRQRQQRGRATNQQQQRQQGGRTSSQQRPIYTGSTSLGGGYGQLGYYSGGGGQARPRGVYTGQGGPGGSGQQQPYYNLGYTQQQGFVNSDYDSECPNTGIRIQINGIPCDQAIEHYGSYLCYRHEFTSRDCCLKCRGLKNPAKVGCEYGDHSGRCQQLQPYDCYDLRNRQSCCSTCERMQKPGRRGVCEYGDMTPNCDRVRQSPGLCYIPENRYLCCDTCAMIRNDADTECPWGDQNPDLCQPFDQSGGIRINCYAPPVRRLCCQSCRRIQQWIPVEEPGCEYGDRPVTFNTGTHRSLNCTSFMRYFGYEQCQYNQAIATNCCYTCHRYRG